MSLIKLSARLSQVWRRINRNFRINFIGELTKSLTFTTIRNSIGKITKQNTCKSRAYSFKNKIMVKLNPKKKHKQQIQQNLP